MINCLLLQPYAEKGAAMMSSMGESYGVIKAGVQDKVGSYDLRISTLS